MLACVLEDGAASIIVAHNHPSGDPTLSKADKDTTQQLVTAGEILGIKLSDHFIVCKGCYFNFY